MSAAMGEDHDERAGAQAVSPVHIVDATLSVLIDWSVFARDMKADMFFTQDERVIQMEEPV